MCREYGATLVQIDTAQENNWILKNFPTLRYKRSTVTSCVRQLTKNRGILSAYI